MQRHPAEDDVRDKGKSPSRQEPQARPHQAAVDPVHVGGERSDALTDDGLELAGPGVRGSCPARLRIDAPRYE
ncbi:hypothetical protein TNCT6_76280 [Streptomyces sp. 6-11-2]|nr:hypothetical protein TNCT6_76280 [Streptomyces sp. 6-11-2]